MGGRDKSGTAEVVATSLQGKNVWLGVGLNDGTADDGAANGGIDGPDDARAARADEGHHLPGPHAHTLR